ncbi:MAG: phosphotransferase [Pseudomonadota bacterium]
MPRLIPSERGHLSEAGWTAEPFLEGQSIDPERMAALAPIVTRFQRLSHTLPQRPGFVSAREFRHKTKGGDIDLGAMPDGVAAACRAAFAALDDRTAIIHSDLTPSNILITPDGHIALIDWDEARRDHPAFDLAQLGQMTEVDTRTRLAWEVACCWKTEPERARALAAHLEPKRTQHG